MDSVDNPMPAAGPAAADSIASLKVMVIDDSNTIRRSAEIFLKQAGCEVVLAEDGFDALAKIVDQRPDVIFCDIMMPRLDGFQTCALIKRNPHYSSHPGDHAVVQGRPVRPRARQHRGRGRIPHQTLHPRRTAAGCAAATPATAVCPSPVASPRNVPVQQDVPAGASR